MERELLSKHDNFQHLLSVLLHRASLILEEQCCATWEEQTSHQVASSYNVLQDGIPFHNTDITSFQIILLRAEAPFGRLLIWFRLQISYLWILLLWFPLCLHFGRVSNQDILIFEVWMTPIRINLSCSLIKDLEKESNEGFFESRKLSLLEWNIETYIE